MLIEELSKYENEIESVNKFYIKGIKKYFIYKRRRQFLFFIQNSINGHKKITKEGKMMSVIFTTIDQKFFYSIVCKNTDIFANLVMQLFNEYPYSKDKSVYFISKVAIIKEQKTLKENQIYNSDIILMDNLKNSSNI